MNTNLASRLSLLLGALLLSSVGCYTTRIHTGLAPSSPSIMYTERWHHAVVLGIAEISDPVDLEGACPQGSWATINEEVSFLNGLVGAALSGVYTPRTYSITCSAGAGAPAGAANWGAPPAGAAAGWGAPPAGTPPTATR